MATSSPLKTTTRSPSPISKIIGQNLVHTVSFYRRQQTLVNYIIIFVPTVYLQLVQIPRLFIECSESQSRNNSETATGSSLRKSYRGTNVLGGRPCKRNY